MIWSKSGVLFVVILLCFGKSIKSSNTTLPRCQQPDILYSYLDFAKYNGTHPYVNIGSVLNPVLDFVLGRRSGVSDTNHDLMVFWYLVCKAEDPHQETEAWKALAREMTHRLHTDDSVYKISVLLFGDEIAGSLMDPHSMQESDAIWKCIDELIWIYEEHCGVLNTYGFMKYVPTFSALCGLGAKSDEFTGAARQICDGYVYISHPLLQPR